ncbi:MAG: DNA primase [Oscillospiraceae bacterium]|nr:DNA primase [Oscillospiraceae bacterium]
MALSQQWLDELHERNDVVELIGSYIALTQRGRLYTGLCPFHNEKTPSFTVYPDTQSYYCFGCGQGGDVITFIKNYENLEYIEAVKVLADRAGMQLPDDTDRSDTDRKRRMLEMNRLAGRFFFSQLNADAGRNARGYLRRRGLSDSTITRFGIGYAPDSWDALRNHLRQAGYRDDEMVEASLCARTQKGNVIDFFRDRVMFPVIDVRGQIVAFSGRTMGGDSRKYVNSRETAVFKKNRTLFGLNFAKNVGSRRVILAEGQMDVIALHQAGFEDAVATLGTAITEEHARQLSRYVDEVIISYDADEAGQKATRRAIDVLRAAGLPVKVVAIEGGKDPDELIKEHGPSAYRALLEKSSGSVEYELARAKRGYDLETAEGRVGYLSDALKVLSRCSSLTEREVWAGRVSEETGVDKATILTGAQRQTRSQRAAEQKKQEAKLPGSIADKLGLRAAERQSMGAAAAERRLVAGLFSHPDLCASVRRKLQENDFVSDETGAIFSALCRLVDSGEFSGFTSACAVLDEKLCGVLSGILADNAGISFTEADAEYYTEKILQRKDKLTADDLRKLDPMELQKRIKNKNNT